MKCGLCHKGIMNLEDVSSMDMGGGFAAMAHTACFAALNAAVSPESASVPRMIPTVARPMGKTINKAYDPAALSPEETAIAISKVVDFSDTPVGSTMEYNGNHFVVGWNKKGLQPWRPSEQWLQEAAKKGMR